MNRREELYRSIVALLRIVLKPSRQRIHIVHTSKGWYVNYKSDKFVEDNLSIDTVVMVLFGLAGEDSHR